MRPQPLLVLVSAVVFGLSGCAGVIKRAAVNSLADALSSGGTVYSGDDSPLLIKQATPFGLKLMETLLAENPRHEKLLLAAAQGFTQYAFAFVKQEADEAEDENFDKAAYLRGEARKLLHRARDYALRALEARHPGFKDQLTASRHEALARLTERDVPELYWAGAAWAAAISISKDNPAAISDLPVVEAMMERALALDESYDNGAIHGFFISYEMSRLGDTETNAKRARKHFERANMLAKGQNAGYYVALAEAVAVPLEDKAEFESLLKQALAINPDADPSTRLANIVFQQRARWLLSRIDRLFI